MNNLKIGNGELNIAQYKNNDNVDILELQNLLKLENAH